MEGQAPLFTRALRPLHAAPASARSGRLERAFNARLFFIAALVPLMLGLAISLIVGFVDPLNLRPWGLQPRFMDANYPELVTPKLVRAVSTQPEDIILIGGSQAMGVTPARLRNHFHARSAFNLSYSLLRAPDLQAVSRAAVRAPGLQRLIVELPLTAMEWNHPPAATGAGALAVLDARWYALPDFGADMARGSLERVRNGVFETPEWKRQAAEFLGTGSILQKRALLTDAHHAFSRVPARTFDNSAELPCSQFPIVHDAILPLAAGATSRRVTLDLYFPAIPPSSYPRAEVQNSSSLRNGSLFANLMSFHRCVALAVAAAGFRNVHVHAIDADPAITLDLANFKDTFHLVKPAAFDRLLDDIATRRFELRPGNFGGYEAVVSGRIIAAYRARKLL